MTLIKTSEHMLSSVEAAQQVARVVRGAQTVLTDGAARTIAGWWANPATRPGYLLGLYSQGTEVEAVDLIADIEATMQENRGMHPCDEDALLALRAKAEAAMPEPEWVTELNAMRVDSLPSSLDLVADDVVSQWIGQPVPWGSLNGLIPADFSWDPEAR